MHKMFVKRKYNCNFTTSVVAHEMVKYDEQTDSNAEDWRWINKELTTYWQNNWWNVIYSPLIESSNLVNDVFASRTQWYITFSVDDYFWLTLSSIVLIWPSLSNHVDICIGVLCEMFAKPYDCILETMLSREMVYKMLESASFHFHLLKWAKGNEKHKSS